MSSWSEDCLYLNVWAPASALPSAGTAGTEQQGRQGLPVLVWLFGGGWQFGFAAEKLYDGRNMTAAQDVILVTVNWRVNVFGFFGLQALAAEEQTLSGQPTTGFYGQQDQRAALAWVQRNVARFGGDPARVALWGQSAGASSICYHMLLPRSSGLFSRAIVDSSCDEAALNSKQRPIPAEASFAARFGCGATNLTCLRAIPAAKLNAALNANSVVTPPVQQTWFYPLWDPSEWPTNATSMMGQWTGGQFFSRVPLLIGSTLEETGWEFCGRDCQAGWGAPFNVTVPAERYSEVFYAALNGSTCDPAQRERLLKLYDLGTWKVGTLVNAMAMMLTDSSGGGQGTCMKSSMNSDAATVASFGLPSFAWVLARRPAAQPWYVGACHGTEQAFVFGNPRWMWHKDQAFTQAEENLSDLMQAAWVRFAATGRPGAGWPAYSNASRNTMVFDVAKAGVAGINNGSRVVTDYIRDRCDFWAGQDSCRMPGWSRIEANVRAALAVGPRRGSAGGGVSKAVDRAVA
eukprot:g1125.t1